jgi:Asp/Glu/hydantoin racemase
LKKHLKEVKMNKIIGILHTTTATVDLLKGLAREILPAFTLLHYVDETILPQVAADHGSLTNVIVRLKRHAECAQEMGADAILNACSSVGAGVALIRASVTIPVVRIDDAMAEDAVQRGEVVGVAATLETTLLPTVRLLEEKAAEAGRVVRIETALVGEAFTRLSMGDLEGHDNLLAAGLQELLNKADVIALAQASMARVLTSFTEDTQQKFLTSPRLGIQHLKRALLEAYGTLPVSN